MSLCLIGKITAVYGIEGGVKIRSYSDIPGRFRLLETVHVGEDERSAEVMVVRSVMENTNKIVLFFDSCRTRTEAAALLGKSVFIRDEQMVPPPEGKHFVHELIGCDVVSSEGEARGVVRDVLLIPGNDVYVVDWKGREVLIPAAPEFIVSVDVPGRKITVRLMPGLFEDADED